MSVQAITAAIAIRGVTASEKLLLLMLANYADEDMRCYPSQRRLATETALSDRTVRALLASLEGRGLLSREERARSDNSRSSDMITLHLTPPEIISGGAETTSGGVRKQFPGGAEMVSGLTTFEPSIEPTSVAKATSDTTRGSRIAADWSPGLGGIAFATSEGLSHADAEREAAKFLDYWRTVPGAKGRKLDWGLTWKGWVRRAAERLPSNLPSRNDRPSPAEQKRAAREANLSRAFAGAQTAARMREFG